MEKKIIKLKKLIKYRLSYTGTKETDILYERIILTNLDDLNYSELFLLSKLLLDLSDIEIFNILTFKSKKPKKYKNLLDKII